MRTYERAGLWIAVSVAIILAFNLRIPERAATAQPTNQIIRVATVDMFQLLESMIDSDRYKPARDARDAEIKSKYDALLAELKSLETKIQLIPQGTPEFQATMSQGQAKEMERQQFAQQVGRDQDAFVASQVKEAYALVHAAVNESAAQLGYTHVFTTRTSATNMKGDSLAPVMQEILARPLVRTSTTDDITDKVRARLGLPEKPAATDDAGTANGGR
ncbi:MAG: OmpH family outer membrane protein [Phycisphaeraceae bacterium]|nr:OmpH family outer membrane protein [Phycisphaeraceae bacterium]MBX3367767.1 OmpH family outer membrane protein [Phycisphaeraceae bacterium]QYK49704.1 MAG: OmpH family outer membrane protein [Phycisphaeraceae bacterium]